VIENFFKILIRNYFCIATFFNYTFSAHDSLEDCKATLFCYTKIVSDKNLKKIAEASDRKFSKRIKEASK
jgi:hypothetical protein